MEADQGVFYKRFENGDIVILAVHVNDCLVTGNSALHIGKFKIVMDQKYKLTDQGSANWLLGICHVAF